MSRQLDRNLYRKVVSYNRPVPKNFSTFDLLTLENKTFNMNVWERDRDYFKIVRNSTWLEYAFGEYEENLMYVDNDIVKSNYYITPFSGIPIVTVALEGSTENIVVYCKSTAIDSLTIGTSADYTGWVRYRAIYAPSYPTQFLSGGVLITATAASLPIAKTIQFTGSYGSFGTIPSGYYYSTFGAVDSDVYVEASSVTNSSICADISEETTDNLNVIVFK